MALLTKEDKKKFGGGWIVFLPLFFVSLHSVLYWSGNSLVAVETKTLEPYFGALVNYFPGFSYRISKMHNAGMNDIMPFMVHLYGSVLVASACLAICNLLFNFSAFDEKLKELRRVGLVKKNTLTVSSFMFLAYILFMRDDIPNAHGLDDLFIAGHSNVIASIIEFFLLYIFLSVILLSFIVYFRYVYLNSIKGEG